MHLKCCSVNAFIKHASNTTSDAAVSSAVEIEFVNTNFIWMVSTLQFLIILTELIERKSEFDVKDDI